MKISDKIKLATESGRPFFSFEYFPPKTEQGVVNLYDRIERMSKLDPLFVAVTWGAGGATAQRTLELCSACQGVFGIETLMHLTCTNMDKQMLDRALDSAKSLGIQNILALRGDIPRGEEYWTSCDGNFKYAIDLVKYIREKYGDYFCIGVAGYPEGHTENNDKEDDLNHLVTKVNAGADFIISQLCYDSKIFIDWERKLRDRGVQIPILPGVLPVQSYLSFRRLSFLTKVFIPELLKEKLELVKANDQAVKDLGVEYAVEMIQQLQAEGVKGVHLTTLNLENTIQRVIDALGMGRNAAAAAAAAVAAGSGLTRLGASTIVRAAKSSVVSQASEQLETPLQQQQQQQKKREDGELVAESSSTQRVWDDFPNGRWGDARSPAFGNLNTYGAMLKFDPHEANQVWGRPQTLGDISSLFVKYVEGSIPSLPWSDEPLLAESGKIQDELVRLNKLGYWTLASQPALDGVNSSDSTYGWGPKGGYIYQKAFVECFVPGDMFPKFLSRLQSATPRITYYASNKQGDFMTNAYSGNSKSDSGNNTTAVTALTWGVFPGRDVVQPTLIDKMNFLAWRTEAFQTWREWADMFPPTSAEARFLLNLAEECWLVNVVDNDYKSPDAVWDIFTE